MRLLFLLISCASAFAQGGSYCTMSTWEPRNLTTKAGLVAYYNPGQSTATAGSAIGVLSNLVTVGTADLIQGTAVNKPVISRSDNCGNLVRQSETFQTTWTLTRCNAFAASDLTNTLNSGSFANTSRVTDPAGGHTSDFIQEDSTASNYHQVGIGVQLSTGSCDFTCWIHQGGRSWVDLVLGLNGVGAAECYFDVANGVVGTATAGAGWSLVSGAIVAGPVNGFYLCRLRGTPSSSGGGTTSIRPASADGGAIYNGDGTSGVFLWGAALVGTFWQAVTGTDATHGYISTTDAYIVPGLSHLPVLYFAGNAPYMKTPSFTLNQPTEIYLQVMPWSWTLNDAFFDGNTLASGEVYESAAAPGIKATAGTVTTQFGSLPVGSWNVLNVVFDGANSRMSTNDGSFSISDAGTGNMSGFSLGAAGTVGSTYWNGMVGKVMICNKTNSFNEASYIRWGLRKGTEGPFINTMFLGDSKTVGYVWVTPFLNMMGNWREDPARIAVVGATSSSTASNIDSDLAARTDNPIVVLINLGVNDYDSLQLGQTNQWKTDYAYILDALHTKWPSVPIYCARVWGRSRMTDAPPAYSLTYLDDVLLPDVLSTRSWALLGIDERNLLPDDDDGATYTDGGIHPNPAGYALEAAAWKTVLGY